MKVFYALLSLLFITQHTYAAGYCRPTPTYPGDICGGYRIDIGLFKLAGYSGTIIDSANCDTTGYLDQTAMSCQLYAGTTYTATLGTNAIHYTMNSQAWIDYNDDSVFSASEAVNGYTYYTGMYNLLPLMIPYSAPPGSHRLRLVATVDSPGHTYPSIDPCMYGYALGECRDYTITIAPGTSSTPCSGIPAPGTIRAAVTGLCNTDTLRLTDSGYSALSGISLQWYSAPDIASGTWAVIPGATNATYTVPLPGTTTFYYQLVTCANGGLTSWSNFDSVIVNKISGHISYSGATPDTAALKVVLYQLSSGASRFLPIDSVITCNDGGSQYYSFNAPVTTLYQTIVKTNDVSSSGAGTAGYVPTYHNSFHHWSLPSGPDYISHGAGYTDTTAISMVHGTATAGTGAISGYIYTGAGAGYTGSEPHQANELVYLEDTSTHVITYGYTNGAGAYSFTNIGDGVYYIFPEEINFGSYHSAPLVLSSAGTGAYTGVNFKRDTVNRRIKPITTAVEEVSPAAFTITPNPAGSRITINIAGLQAEAYVTITDLMGREVYQAPLTTPEIALPVLTNGVYLLKLNSSRGTYTQRLMIER